MKKFAILLILFNVSITAFAQSYIGPQIGLGFITIGDRALTKDFKIKPSGVETQIGAAFNRELSPFTSLRAGLGYSFQDFEYSTNNSVNTPPLKDSMAIIKSQFVNINSGLLFTLFDEGVHSIRPYGSINLGFSILADNRSTEELTPYTMNKIELSNLKLTGGLGAGAFMKLSEFTRVSLGINYDRSFTEIFKNSDVRQNRIQALLEVSFQL